MQYRNDRQQLQHQRRRIPFLPKAPHSSEADPPATTSTPLLRSCWACRKIRARSISSRMSITPASKSFAFYVRDSWQLSRKLTVNYGARWDFFRSRGAKAPALRSTIRARHDVDLRSGLGARRLRRHQGQATYCSATRSGLPHYRLHRHPGRLCEGSPTRSLSSAKRFPAGKTLPTCFRRLSPLPNSLSYAVTFRPGAPGQCRRRISAGTIPVPGYALSRPTTTPSYIRGYMQTW